MKSNIEHAQRERAIFSTNFKRILEARGKTQADVACDLQITSSTVSDWANAKKYPRVDKMQILSDYLGVLISDLREEKSATLLDGELSPKCKTLMSTFAQLDADTQNKLLELANLYLSDQDRKK